MSREMVLVVQGLVILFSGALAGFSRPLVRRLLPAGRHGAAPDPAGAR